MGAWGVLAFDNDDANDWAYGLEEVEDLSLVVEAFAAAEGAESYLEAPDACNALAACEVLARLRGNFGYQNAYTEKVDAWVKKHPQKPAAELVARADEVIRLVLGPQSELRELWEEGKGDRGAGWVKAVEDLRRRVGG